MKNAILLRMRKKPLALLIGTMSLAWPGAHADETGTSQDRGKMIDRSNAIALPTPASSERESAEFDKLPHSALTMAERKVMLETPVPETPSQQRVVMQDQLDGANFESGKAVLLRRARQTLDVLVEKLKGKLNIRFQIVGHTDNQRIAAWLKPTYPNNQALSEARALAVAAYIKEHMSLPAEAFSVSGLGDTVPVASNDTPEGMAQNRRTTIRVWFEEPVKGPEPLPPRKVEQMVAQDKCAPEGVKDGMPFSISIDGRPLETDTKQQEADRQRCVDVALEKAAIQIKYDPMTVAPALNVWAAPGAALRGKPLEFGTYTNYAWWIKRAEIRLFTRGQNTQQTPFAVVPVAVGGTVQWDAPADAPEEIGYLLRVYDAQGRFDETSVKPLRLLDRAPVERIAERANKEKLNGWGETTLALKNIPASGGTVTISGERIKAGETVTALGVPVPVDAKGKFAMRQILPAGPHAVEVSVRDSEGKGASFRRNLSIADHDWFYVAMADLTVGRDNTTGPAQLVTADTQHYDNKTWVDGRGAFYLRGKIKGEYLLTASADTREQPIKDLFSNFQTKDPYYLLRRIDPDKYYPVYGDDSTIVDDAPTQGKFYVRLEKGDSQVMWGNFKTAWTGTELTQYSRGLYGANAIWKSQEATSFGEKISSVNVFAAEPGTLASREEFRGTGGSLYYLHQQDLTQGSDRVWVEVRDKDSGMVIQRTLLTPAQDYEINYLQGRITLRSPLSSVADGSALVQTAGVNGNPVYLVVTYEYVPGLTAISGNTAGLRASHWFGDNVRLGVTSYHQGDDAGKQDLKGVDATFRYKPGTWVKLEGARSSGVGGATLTSLTGGFSFSQPQFTGAPANAKRVEAAVDLSEISDAVKGRLAAYWQDREAGFSGPGQAVGNGEATRQSGLTAAVPVGERSEVAVKVDERTGTTQFARVSEAAIRHKIDAEWGISAGVRHDDRMNTTSTAAGTVVNASPILNQNGGRNDVVVRIDYRPLDSAQDDAAASQTAGAATKTATARNAAATAANAATGPASTLMTGSGSTAVATGGKPVSVDPQAAAGIAGARMPGLRYKPWDLYGFAQHTLSRSGDRSQNDRIGLGSSWQASDRLRLGAELSGGSGGAGGKVAGNYAVTDRSDLYLGYALETEAQDVNYSGRQGTLTAGSHYKLTDNAGVFGETRWQNGAGPQSLTHAFGVDLAPSEQWTTGVKFETGTLSDPVAGDLKRNAIGMTASYRYEKTKFTTALEYRTDKNSSLGTVTGSCSTPATNCVSPASVNDRRSWLTKNSLGYQLDPAWRLLAKLNLSRSVSSQGAFYDGDYTEAVLGAAYRPVDNDRWNALFKYTFFYNLPSPGQVDGVTGTPVDYTQKSHVFNADFIYDVRPWVSVGMKYGIRVGDLKPSKTVGDWFSSRADLVVARADFHWVREWDALVEARRLKAREAGDARSGYLLGIYRHVGQHAKIGVGYNFTDFSDDLTDLSYRSRGWFINALGSF